MKRFGIFFGIMSVACVSVMGQLHSQPYQLSLTPDIAMQLRGTQIDGLSLGVWSENSQRALALGFVNGSVGLSKGFSLGILGNYAESYSGFELGLMNSVKGDLTGAQLGLVNVVKNQMVGFELGLINYVKGAGSGCQLGVINRTEGEFSGFQAGALNIATSVAGVQLGAVNVASVLNGVQIGVINCAETTECSVLQIGFANIIPQNEVYFLNLPEELGPAFVVVNWRF